MNNILRGGSTSEAYSDIDKMQVDTKNKELVGEVTLQNSGLNRVYCIGPGNFDQLSKERDMLLDYATFSESIDLVYQSIKGPDEDLRKKVLGILEEGVLFTDTSVLFTPRGVYFKDHPYHHIDASALEESRLIKALASGDKNTRFAGWGSFKGDYSYGCYLWDNNFVKGMYGEGDIKRDILRLGELDRTRSTSSAISTMFNEESLKYELEARQKGKDGLRSFSQPALIRFERPGMSCGFSFLVGTPSGNYPGTSAMDKKGYILGCKKVIGDKIK